ncbi:MAG: hypothetical protein K9W44_05010 [Candidatus Lokiarchaeota archaeon]|nr:hypothetical protein [Candidatus Harpocratesius repetitus]
MYLFGEYAHQNEKYQVQYKQIQNHPALSLEFDVSFLFIAISFATCLREIIKINKKIIDFLKYNTLFNK